MTTHGLEAEVRAALAAEGGDAGASSAQLDLGFDDLPSPIALQAESVGLALRPGRPRGSRNRSTLDVVQLIKATKRPTLLALKELADLTIDEFVKVSGISDRDKAFARWLQIAELVTAYEEGRPTQRVEVAGEVALPVVVMTMEPVRPDLVNGNPPTEGEMLDVTDFTVVQENQ